MMQNTRTKQTGSVLMAVVFASVVVDAARVQYTDRAAWEAAVAGLSTGGADFNHLNPPSGGSVAIPQDADFDAGSGLTLFHYEEDPAAAGGVRYFAGDVTAGSKVSVDGTNYIFAGLDGTPDRLLKLKFPGQIVAWGFDWALPSLTDTCLGVQFGDDPFFPATGLSKPGSGFLGYVYTDGESANELTLRDNCASTVFLNFDNVAWASPSAPTGGASGDPHFQTWSGNWFDFHGICDMHLLKDEQFYNGLGLDIQLRTAPRYEYSYIEAASVKIGDDILEVGSWGEYWLNGVESVDMPFKMGADNFEVTGGDITGGDINKKKTRYEIKISETETIVIGSFKDMVHVEVENASPALFKSSVGMMGTYPEGKLLSRNGSVMEDTNAFGKEWQVRPDEESLFLAPSKRQELQLCVPPTPSGRRRLGEGISQEAAETACRLAGHEGGKLDRCIFDVIAMADLEVAEASGAY